MSPTGAVGAQATRTATMYAIRAALGRYENARSLKRSVALLDRRVQPANSRIRSVVGEDDHVVAGRGRGAGVLSHEHSAEWMPGRRVPRRKDEDGAQSGATSRLRQTTISVDGPSSSRRPSASSNGYRAAPTAQPLREWPRTRRLTAFQLFSRSALSESTGVFIRTKTGRRSSISSPAPANSEETASSDLLVWCRPRSVRL